MDDRSPNNPTQALSPGSAALGPLVERIDHVGLAVADLDAAIDFYAKVFGLQSVHEEVNEEQGVREAMVDIAGSGSYLQLLAPLREDSPIGRFLARSGEGMQQLAFRVSDIDAASQRLRDAGVRLLYPEPKRGTSGSRVNFVHPKDCGGVLVELVEPAREPGAR
ncbi:MAG: methylmalonyl-CoA epimerase [Candidatus Nanopelagicales bacterium]